MKLYTMEKENQASGRLATEESKHWRRQEVPRWGWCFSGSWRRGGRRREREKVSPRGDTDQYQLTCGVSHEEKKPM